MHSGSILQQFNHILAIGASSHVDEASRVAEVGFSHKGNTDGTDNAAE